MSETLYIDEHGELNPVVRRNELDNELTDLRSEIERDWSMLPNKPQPPQFIKLPSGYILAPERVISVCVSEQSAQLWGSEKQPPFVQVCFTNTLLSQEPPAEFNGDDATALINFFNTYAKEIK